MSTSSQLATLQAIRARLLAYESGALLSILSVTASGAGSTGRFYIDHAPDTVAYPYGVLRIIDWREQGDDGGFARRCQVEIHLVTRPRSGAATIKDAADLCERALRAWVDVTAGVIVAQRGLTRATVTYEAPADREVVLERLVVPLYVHPQYLTQDSA